MIENDHVIICSGITVLEEEKDETNQLKDSENLVYPRFHYQLRMMPLVYKAKSNWEWSPKNLFRENSARSCH